MRLRRRRLSRSELEERIQREVDQRVKEALLPRIADLECHLMAVEESVTVLGERLTAADGS